MQKTLLNRTVQGVWTSQPTLEGAGVRLKRAFGSVEPRLDPFLLLDAFRSENPDDYRRGFPWHPHRGMETITYILEGEVEHGDSMGNQGLIKSGDVQWMTAGSGIIHQEMPHGDGKGRMFGFQLWSNLPARSKMMDPRYQEVKSADIPVVQTSEGATVRVVSGQVNGVQGAVRDIVTDPEYLDVTLPAGRTFTHPVSTDHNVFAYVFEGQGRFGTDQTWGTDNVILYGPGEQVVVTAENTGVRFLLVSGRPLGEPVAWGGPIVMNTRDELRHAFQELEAGTFVKHH